MLSSPLTIIPSPLSGSKDSRGHWGSVFVFQRVNAKWECESLSSPDGSFELDDDCLGDHELHVCGDGLLARSNVLKEESVPSGPVLSVIVQDGERATPVELAGAVGSFPLVGLYFVLGVGDGAGYGLRNGLADAVSPVVFRVLYIAPHNRLDLAPAQVLRKYESKGAASCHYTS